MEGVVKAAPWVMVVLLIKAVTGALAHLGLGAFWFPFGWEYGHGLGYVISLAFALLLVALRGLSLPGLFNRTATGWQLAYYSLLVSALSSVVHFNPPALLLSAAGLYLLFQVRSYYR